MWTNTKGSNERIITCDFVLDLCGSALYLIYYLLWSQLDLESCIFLGLRELAPYLTCLRRLLIDELIVQIVLVECIGSEVVLVKQILFNLAEILCKIATEVVGLEIVGLEINGLVACGAGSSNRPIVICEGIKHFFRRSRLLLYFFLASLLWSRLWKGIKVEVPKIIRSIFSFSVGEITKLWEWIGLLFFIFAWCPLLFFFVIGLTEHIFKVAIVYSQLELVEIVWCARDPEDMAFNFVHEIEVDVEETACRQAYFFSV